jgi:hypothetical protein
MWSRVLIRLLSLSFMSFFVIGLLWPEIRRQGKTRRRKPVADKGEAERVR